MVTLVDTAPSLFHSATFSSDFVISSLDRELNLAASLAAVLVALDVTGASLVLLPIGLDAAGALLVLLPIGLDAAGASLVVVPVVWD